MKTNKQNYWETKTVYLRHYNDMVQALKDALICLADNSSFEHEENTIRTILHKLGE